MTSFHDLLMLFWDCLIERESDLMCGDFMAINEDLQLITMAKAWVLANLDEEINGGLNA